MADQVFVDESKRGPYLMCALVAGADARRQIRQAMTGLLAGGEGRLHMKDERDSRKRVILSTLAGLGVRALMFTSSRRPQHLARADILRDGIWPLIVANKAERLVLEAEVGQDVRDRRILFELVRAAGVQSVFTYHHQTPRCEPLLWVPDAIAWAYGKGGEWRRRAAHLVAESVEIEGP